MITVVFVYAYEDRPSPNYAHNTRNGGRIAYTTQIGPNQNFGSVYDQLARHTRIRPFVAPPHWRFMWHSLHEVNMMATPSAMYGDDYGVAANEQMIIYCVETLNYPHM